MDKAQRQREKQARYMQHYSAGEIRVGQVVGQYPPEDYVQKFREQHPEFIDFWESIKATGVVSHNG